MSASAPPANPLAQGETYRHWIECSRKRPFYSRKSAVECATRIRKRGGGDKGVYQCSHCGQWHLYTMRGKR
jgi:hypothetical protein